MQFWAHAQNTGLDYGLVNYYDQCKLIALHLLKFGTANSDDTIGTGLVRSGLYNIPLGSTDELGDGSGHVTYDGSYQVNKLFGIEAISGVCWEFRPNVYFNSGGTYFYEGNVIQYEPPYVRSIPRYLGFNQTYIKTMYIGDYCDFIPKSGTGSSTTYWCDGSWSNENGQLLLVGGASDNGSFCGVSAASSGIGSSDAYANNGARLT